MNTFELQYETGVLQRSVKVEKDSSELFCLLDPGILGYDKTRVTVLHMLAQGSTELNSQGVR